MEKIASSQILTFHEEEDRVQQTNDERGANDSLLEPNATAPISDEERRERKQKKRRILRNLIVFSASLLLEFSAMNALFYLQSSLNKEGNLGVICLFTSWVANALCCLFLPSLLLKFVGYKWSICICQTCLLAYIGANFVPSYYTLFPASILLGIVNGIIWTYQGSFVSHLAKEYALLSSKKRDIILVKFFGIFMVIFQLSKFESLDSFNIKSIRINSNKLISYF